MNRIKLGTLLLVLALPAAAFGNGHDPEGGVKLRVGLYGATRLNAQHSILE